MENFTRRKNHLNDEILGNRTTQTPKSKTSSIKN